MNKLYTYEGLVFQRRNGSHGLSECQVSCVFGDVLGLREKCKNCDGEYSFEVIDLEPVSVPDLPPAVTLENHSDFFTVEDRIFRTVWVDKDPCKECALKPYVRKCPANCTKYNHFSFALLEGL